MKTSHATHYSSHSSRLCVVCAFLYKLTIDDKVSPYTLYIVKCIAKRNEEVYFTHSILNP